MCIIYEYKYMIRQYTQAYLPATIHYAENRFFLGKRAELIKFLESDFYKML